MDILRQANLSYIDIEAIERVSGRNVAKMNPNDLVRYGQRLWWMTKLLGKAFEPVKVRLREIAIARSAGTLGAQRFDADDGSFVIVSMQPGTLIKRKDAKMEAVQKLLGTKFDLVFDTTVTYQPRKDFQDHIGDLTPDELTAVMAVVDMADASPKVAFKD